MQNAWHAQHELRNRRIKLGAIFRYHLIAAGHGAYLCGEHGAAGVFEALLGLEHRLFSHYSLTTHFLHVAVGIRDNPVTAKQLDGDIADIGEGDGVGKNKAIVGFIGLFGQIIYVGGNVEAVFVIVVHCAISPHFSRHGKQSN